MRDENYLISCGILIIKKCKSSIKTAFWWKQILNTEVVKYGGSVWKTENEFKYKFGHAYKHGLIKAKISNFRKKFLIFFVVY